MENITVTGRMGGTRVVAAFVGYSPDMERPFAVSTNHGNALLELGAYRTEHGLDVDGTPKYQGFVVKDNAGLYRYVTREEAFYFASGIGQLRSDAPLHSRNGRLDSYDIAEWNEYELHLLSVLSERVCGRFAKDRQPGTRLYTGKPEET